jgi:putative lipoprotein (rSAM/lipoprotein system)
MKRQRRSILRLSNTLISGLLTMLGFTSACNTEEMMMYGTPWVYADFMIKGKVSNEATGEPISKIKVKTVYDSTFTDSDGKYVVLYYGEAHTDSVLVEYIDNDGKVNGEYLPLDKQVSFEGEKFSGGDSGLSKGVVIKEGVDIELTEKK